MALGNDESSGEPIHTKRNVLELPYQVNKIHYVDSNDKSYFQSALSI